MTDAAYSFAPPPDAEADGALKWELKADDGSPAMRLLARIIRVATQKGSPRGLERAGSARGTARRCGGREVRA